MDYQPQFADGGQLPSWQTMILGLVSGAMGPFSNAPIDTIKTYVPFSTSTAWNTTIDGPDDGVDVFKKHRE